MSLSKTLKVNRNCSKHLKIGLKRLPFTSLNINCGLPQSSRHENINMTCKELDKGKEGNFSNVEGLQMDPEVKKTLCVSILPMINLDKPANNVSGNYLNKTIVKNTKCKAGINKQLNVVLHRIKHDKLVKNINANNSIIEKPIKNVQRKIVDATVNIEKQINDGICSQPNKIVKIAPNRSIKRPSTPLVSRLRKGPKKNYLDISLETTASKEKTIDTNRPRVPIYRQIVIDKGKQTLKDPYELDISDSDQKKTSRKQINISGKFDKTMQGILKKLEKNEQKKTAKEKKVALKKSKYKNNVKNAIKRVMNKINLRNNCVNDNTKNKAVTLNDVPEIQETMIEATVKPSNIISRNITIVTNPTIASDVNTSESADKPHDLKHLENADKEDSLSVVSSPPEDHFDIDSNGFVDSTYLDDKYFGFGDDDECQNNKKIKVLSNVMLNKCIDSPSLFTKRKPNANSTMLQTKTSSPWRISIAKRNPHNLIIKNTSLPCLRQEMVLDHTLVDKIGEPVKTTTIQSSQKSPVQTTMLEYISSSSHEKENEQENYFHPSLFDYEEFNIVKRNRKVLVSLQESNILAVSTPKKVTNSTATIVEDKENSYFGFDRTSDEPSVRQKQSSKVGPSRIYSKDIKLIKKNVIEFDLEETTGGKESLPVLLNEEEPIENGKKNNIFDDMNEEPEPDLSIKLPSVKYDRKKRRKRLISDASSHNDDMPKRKKKNAMTKAEEAEFEKWAATFNSMCEEVEKHQLEID